MGVLIGESTAQEPTFPQTDLKVTPSGMQITTILAPGIALTTNIGEEAMNNIMKMWVQTRKNVQDQLRVIEKVNASKVN